LGLNHNLPDTESMRPKSKSHRFRSGSRPSPPRGPPWWLNNA